jgi:STE24 endopeptidase
VSWTRAAVIVAVAGFGAAAILALVSRAPSELRTAEPGPGARDPDEGARFTDEQIARHGAYRRAAYAGWGLGLMVQVVTLVALARGPVASVAGGLERTGAHWVVRHVLVALMVLTIMVVVTMPLAYVGFEIGHAWGLSTQSVPGWIADRARGLLVGGVLAALSAVVFFGVVRWQPRLWWVWGWLAFSILTVLIAYVWPVLVAPLFNRFEPLHEGSLRRRVTALVDAAGVGVGDVLVVDASKRSRAENAYVAGIGTSKRLVLFDTLIAGGDEDEAAFVVAHELGHQVENHVLKNVLLSIGGLFVGFVVLAWLADRPDMVEWAGVSGIGDLRALPLLLLFAIAANTISLPVENAISRHFEARADAIALELTRDPDTAVTVFRRLAFSNLADLRPPAVAVWTLFSHPPIADRIQSARTVDAP